MEVRCGGFETVGGGFLAGGTGALGELGHAFVVMLGCDDREDVDESGGEVLGTALGGGIGLSEESGDWVGVFDVGEFGG